ncbi:FtsX-like permease family protein [Phocaeicola dorei]|nr:FtsX-like permease family protein [Phocaeicola dorei]
MEPTRSHRQTYYTIIHYLYNCRRSEGLPLWSTDFTHSPYRLSGWRTNGINAAFCLGILFKYKEGTWNECRKALEHLYQTECSPENILRLNSEEEVYNNYLRSEEMLTRLLSFASLVCILTAMFGIYSLVTLTCEQRRKEIAIRKVNGATVWSILFLFFREYLIMLCIAALFAFPITYVIIKQWILNYVRQVSISPLPFILILIGLALTVIAGISWRVWKAANENPAEVIKNE